MAGPHRSSQSGPMLASRGGLFWLIASSTGRPAARPQLASRPDPVAGSISCPAPFPLGRCERPWRGRDGISRRQRRTPDAAGHRVRRLGPSPPTRCGRGPHRARRCRRLAARRAPWLAATATVTLRPLRRLCAGPGRWTAAGGVGRGPPPCRAWSTQPWTTCAAAHDTPPRFVARSQYQTRVEPNRSDFDAASADVRRPRLQDRRDGGRHPAERVMVTSG
jgi:hypothetical protein